MLLPLNRFNLKRQNGFIALEGVNGAGKSTVAEHIVNHFKKSNLPYIKTFEPGDTPLGSKIREAVLGPQRDIVSPVAELLLFAADRAEHVERVIKPALEKSQLVISDRYFYSTTAFQGFGRGLDRLLIENLNTMAVQNVYPDFVILLDIDPAEGLKRNKKAADSTTFSVDALEREELAFHQRIQQGFLKIAEQANEPFVIIDASQPRQLVLDNIDVILSQYLK